MQGGDTCKQGDSFLLGLTLKLCEELLNSVFTWSVPYKQFSSDCLDSCSTVNGQHSVWKATTSTEDKNKSAQWFAVHVVCPAVMKYLNSGKSPYVCVFTESWAVASGLALWSGRRTMETCPIKRMPVQGMILWKL